MSATLTLSILVVYFALLYIISYFTSYKSTYHTFFTADRQAKWWMVSFGMLGTTLSGITFISVPGMVAEKQFTYMQIVMGYLLGYFLIAKILLPIYYKYKLVSIYSYLQNRLGFYSYKMGAFFFILSRTLGAALRLFLVAVVLQNFLFEELGVSFIITIAITIFFICLYTLKGGIKTVIWTDILQTTFLLLALLVTLFSIKNILYDSFPTLLSGVMESGYSQIFIWDYHNPHFFIKDFLAGVFISIVMTGMDQDMMQKNLTCKNIAEAKKNMYAFSIFLVVINALFLLLGALLYLFSTQKGIVLPQDPDSIFPFLSKNYLGLFVAFSFFIGIIAATYSSADSALTALTTSFCIDFLNFEKRKGEKKKIRYLVHLGFSILLFLVVYIFYWFKDSSIIDILFVVSGYTYGPLLGLFTFAIFTRYTVKDKWVPFICISSPISCYILQSYSQDWFWGYQFGYELLMVNGLITFSALFLIRKKI